MVFDNHKKWIQAFKNSESRKYLFGYKPTKIAFILLSYLRKGSKILDLGCGAGRNSIFLAKKGYEVFAIDFIPDAIKELKKFAEKRRLKINTFLQDITRNLHFKNNFFDAVLINVVLDSLSKEKREKLAKEIFRILKKDGLVFIYEPSVNDEYYKQFVKRDNLLICPDDKIQREIFTKESLIAPFKNFEIVGIKENFPFGRMFGKKYRRAFWIAILKKKQNS